MVDSTSSNPSRSAFGRSADAADLTAAQQKALQKLHQTAQQMEALFVGLLFKEMRKTAPQGGGLTGQPSQAEQMFGEMLDEKRAEQLSQTSTLGIAKVIEEQLRASVLADVPRQNDAQEGQKR
jgi:flagellar protein FlgJ